jgi:phenylalanyl-tRNA synthetase beta chain
MKISYKWLKDYIDINLSIEDLAQKITDSGIEVEDIFQRIDQFNNIVLGKVEAVEKHPDADKLSVCKVTDGSQHYQVICGAANVSAGQRIPFAKIGSTFPNGLKIKKAKIRGIESQGMICSKEELGLEDKSQGIWELKSDKPLGTDINEVLADLQDSIFDLFVTSNRPDCLSHIGVAREIAAFTGKKVKYPQISFKESAEKTADFVKVEIEYAQGCPRYTARLIKNVKTGPSPEWLKQKLEAIGSRSINNIVDITNFVLNELGQPLHAFDYDLVKGQQIIVKKSMPKQKFTTLDNKERVIPEETVMICDAEKAVAIGGVMGGLNSEVHDSTTNILLESAYFNPVNIIQTTRKLGLITDASTRFDKGTDHDNVIYALDRASQLIQELAGGEITLGVVDCYPKKIKAQVVPFRPARVNRILGTSLSEDKIMKTLASLDLNISKQGISIPSYRVDLKKEIDLVEEVARLINLDEIPTSNFEPVFLDQKQNIDGKLFEYIRTSLIDIGLQEVFTNSMISAKNAALVSKEQLKILNPISDDLSTMRPSLLPGLLNVIQHNKNRNNHDLKIFEIGRIFKNEIKNDLPDQPVSAAIAFSGSREPEYWGCTLQDFDYYDLKGYLEMTFDAMHLAYPEFKIQKSDIYNSDYAVELLMEKTIVGHCGKLDLNLCKAFDIKTDVFYAELNLDILKKFILLNKKYRSIGKYPYIEKDLALLLENNISSMDVVNHIKDQGGKLLRNVDIFDVYSDKKMKGSQKSIAFRLKFQSDERTLKDDEVDQIFRKIIKKCQDKFNATLREG